jgi:hypothetical protein
LAASVTTTSFSRLILKVIDPSPNLRARESYVPCTAVGRDPATLDITVGLNVRFDDLLPAPAPGGDPPAPAIGGTVDDVAAGLAAHGALGASHLIVALEPTTPEAVRRLATAADLARPAGDRSVALDPPG